MKLTREKGFTLVEFLIIIVIIGILSIFLIMSRAKAMSLKEANNIARGLMDCRKAVLACYADNPGALNCDDKEDKVEEITKYLNSEKTASKDNAAYSKYFSDVVCNVVQEDGQEVKQLFIEYSLPDVKLEDDVLRGLAQYAKTLRLYKSPEDLSDNNLITVNDIQRPFYMLIHEEPKS